MNRRLLFAALFAMTAMTALTGCPRVDPAVDAQHQAHLDWLDHASSSYDHTHAGVPLAVGATGTLLVDRHRDPNPVFDAQSDDPTIARVVAVEADRVHLRGVAEGDAVIRIVAERGVTEATIAVRPASNFGLEAAAIDGVALSGGTEIFALRLYDADGEPLAGGAAVDLVLDPDGVARQQPSPPWEVHVRYEAVGEVEFADRWGVRRRVIDPATLAEVSLTLDPGTIAVGASAWGVLRARDAAGEDALGFVGLLAVESLDAARCSAGLRERFWSWFAAVEIIGHRPGRCPVRVTLAGHSAEAELQVR